MHSAKVVYTAMVVAVVLGTSPASGTPIEFVATWEFSVSSGPDGRGLGGASAEFRALFDTTQTYVNLFGSPFAEVLSEPITITGASVPSSNGVFTASGPFGIFATSEGQFFSNSGGAISFDIGAGTFLLLTGLTSPVTGPLVGDNLRAEDFGTTLSPSASLRTEGADITAYGFSGFAASATVIPEPRTLTLFGIGIGMLGMGRFRRRRKQTLSSH